MKIRYSNRNHTPHDHAPPPKTEITAGQDHSAQFRNPTGIVPNKQLLAELGPDAYFRRQLDVLKDQPATGDAEA